MVDVSTTITGIKLKHPLMNASGVLASSRQGVARLVETGVSAVVTKTLTLEPREGYLPPITLPLPYGLLNAVGLANPGIDSAVELVEEAHRHGLPVVVSIGGRDDEEFHELGVKALEAGADALELNLSCPHTPGYGVDLSATVETIRSVVSAVSSISEKPVWVKLGYSRSLVREAGVALDAGASALVLINTIPGMAIDVYVGKPVLSHGYGGLSGPAIHPVAVYSVYTVYKEYGVDIVGVGGVVDWSTAVELLMAGARALQVATAFYLKGLGVVEEIVNGLIDYMNYMGYRNLEEVIGLAHKQ